MQAQVPPIITAECICWYGAWRSDREPSLEMAEAMRRLAQTWREAPDLRRTIDDEIRVVAHGTVGDHPPDLVSSPV